MKNPLDQSLRLSITKITIDKSYTQPINAEANNKRYSEVENVQVEHAHCGSNSASTHPILTFVLCL